MKKLFSLLVIVLLVAGCNKQKTLQKELTGTWQAYKYILRNADETQQFTNQYGNYAITFNGSGKFILSTTVPDTTLMGGTYYFTDNNEQLVLVDTTYVTIDSVNFGVANKQQYTIFDLTSANLQLVTDSSDLYLEKKQ